MTKWQQPWLSNPLTESVFILAPSILPVVAVFIFRDYFMTNSVSTFWWIALVLCVDVSHVYSTLFRMYWDKPTFDKYKRLLVLIPLIGFVIGFAIHFYDSMLFWRVLAYVAVYHFVRQQYGFMRLYSRHEHTNRLYRTIDTLTIYAATIYPLVYWHLNATEKIAWFIQGDFIRIDLARYTPVFTFMYVVILLAYVIKETVVSVNNEQFNLPKNFIVAGTCLSWYVGIVAFQADLIFTLLNVVAHGIPYMALIWIYGEKKGTKKFDFNWKGVAIFSVSLLTLAYFEENLWDSFVWKDHVEVFPFLADISPVNNPLVLSIVVALLVLPQVTHYVLDGFIWRFSKDTKARI